MIFGVTAPAEPHYVPKDRANGMSPTPAERPTPDLKAAALPAPHAGDARERHSDRTADDLLAAFQSDEMTTTRRASALANRARPGSIAT
jgi:hypothetical protein